MYKRFILIVLDGCGVGALPDASFYGDEGANTLYHTLAQAEEFSLPFFQRSGLGNILGDLLPYALEPLASWGIALESSVGKDSVIGHWEMMGIFTRKPFPVFPNGFPEEIIQQFEKAIGKKVLGNCVASGTEIIKQLGEEHMRTGYPIVYTSADSVFQIACHEEVVPLDEIYNYCRLARSLLVDKYGVLRVIARPFIGSLGNFVRTANRKDFVLPPPERSVLDTLEGEGISVDAFGKIEDVFSGRGITHSRHTSNNYETLEGILSWLEDKKTALCFANLNDFDTLWGHRRLPLQFLKGLEEADGYLERIYERLNPDDILLVTADHGNDPTFKRHTDHTREAVPIFLYKKGLLGEPLGVRSSFADVGATILSFFQVLATYRGEPLFTAV